MISFTKMPSASHAFPIQTVLLISILAIGSPLFGSSEIDDKGAYFEENRHSLQPWTLAKGYPTTRKHIGLSESIELFDTATYGDGGSIYWIIKDNRNNYFAFWKEPEQKWNAELKTSINLNWNERGYWIGTTHPAYFPTGLEIPKGSESEEFLNELIRRISQ